MNTNEITKKLKDYGAETDVIIERFMGDMHFYSMCLEQFFADKTLEQLSQAVDAGDCRAAFEAAHTLKGTAGNMGLTPLYNAICSLVELLRTGSLENAESLCENVVSQFNTAKSIFS